MSKVIAFESAKWKVETRLEKYKLGQTSPYKVIETTGNCLLNTGINELWDIFIGDSANHFSNAQATIGVGDSNAAAAPGQTDLQAGANKHYNAMDGGFPSVVGQTVTFKTTFTGAEANFAWEEWVVKQATSTICLNRKVTSHGTKPAGETWILSVAITLS